MCYARGMRNRNRDKQKQAGYQAKHYKANRASAVAKNKERRQGIAKWVAELKIAAGCADCGYKTCSAALSFHHLGDDKKFCIGNAVSNGWGQVRILAEVAKCIVLCANCHLTRHHCQK